MKFSAGAVWVGQIDFGDGPRKKYFVLLNDCMAGEQFFCAITTSQHSYAETASPCGCPGAPCYRLEPGQVACFPLQTWIQFDNKGYLSHAGLEALERDGQASFLQMLDEDKLRSVLACAKKSTDVPRRDLARIERTLKEKLAHRKMPAKKTATAASLPSTASKEVLEVRARFNRRCTTCRSQVIEVIGIAEAELAALFQGTKLPSDSFVGDAVVGLDLIEICRECSS